jgi:RHS repeat-associated protein
MVCLSASFFRRSPLALGRWLPTFRAMAVSSVLKNSHSRTIPRRMPAHVGAGVPANRNVHRGLSRSTYDSHRGEYYVDELLATQTSASNNDISGYTLCANEWDSFALPSTCDVAYGAKGSFVFRSAQSGTITFNNATFGDPAPGAPKKGYYRLSGGQRFYAHANHLYSVAALTNQAGGVVERYRYDTYGNRTTLAPDGITTRAASLYNQQVGFTGRYLDRETGLWYFRARYYSGTLGRFVGRDPLEYVDGMCLYNGCFVPNGLDPLGTTATCPYGSIETWRSKSTRKTPTGATKMSEERYYGLYSGNYKGLTYSGPIGESMRDVTIGSLFGGAGISPLGSANPTVGTVMDGLGGGPFRSPTGSNPKDLNWFFYLTILQKFLEREYKVQTILTLDCCWDKCYKDIEAWHSQYGSTPPARCFKKTFDEGTVVTWEMDRKFFTEAIIKIMSDHDKALGLPK